MQHCPVCSSGALVELLQAERVPVFCNVQWPDREQAKGAPHAGLEIVACGDCGHAHNAAFDPELVAYSPAYDNSQHFSTTFREYATRLVDRLVETYDIRDKRVVDIGCGRGDLLALFADRGRNRGFGFDPSFDESAIAQPHSNITISREYFLREHAAEIAPALVCCRHVLEHVFDPVQFLGGLRESMSAAGSPLLYLEVPSGDHLLRSAGIWDYIYEHYSYFSRRSLELALGAAGFEVVRMYEDFGGQFLCADARARHEERGGPAAESGAAATELAMAIDRMRSKLGHWRTWAQDLTGSRRSTTVWGAGSKGVMFLNLLGLSAPDPVDFVIDQNPNKSGRYLAISGQVVLPPARLDHAVDDVIVMNGIYLEEIKSYLANRGLGMRVGVAWP